MRKKLSPELCFGVDYAKGRQSVLLSEIKDVGPSLEYRVLSSSEGGFSGLQRIEGILVHVYLVYGKLLGYVSDI